MLAKYFILFCVGLCVVEGIYSQYSSLANHYDISDGLPSNTIYCVEQDDVGFMWFGTDQGLVRFDGEEFKIYKKEDGLPDLEILNFHKDFNGRIWFYTLNGKIGFVENGAIISSLNSDLFNGIDFKTRITSIKSNRDKIFISSLYDGFIVLDDNLDLLYNHEPPPSTVEHNYLQVLQEHLYVISNIGPTDRKELKLRSYNLSDISSGKYQEQVQSWNVRHSLTYTETLGNSIIALTLSRTKQFLVNFLVSEGKAIKIPLKNFYAYNVKKVEDKVFLLTDDGLKTISKDDYSIKDYGLLDLPPSSKVTDVKWVKDVGVWVTSLDRGIYFFLRSKIEKELQEVKREDGSIRSVSALGVNKDSLLYIVYNDSLLSSISKNSQFVVRDPISRKLPLRKIEIDSLNRLVMLGFTYLNIAGNIQAIPRRSALKDGLFIYPTSENGLVIENLITGSKKKIPGWNSVYVISDFVSLSKSQLVLADFLDVYLLDLENKRIVKLLAFENKRIKEIVVDDYDGLWFSSLEDGIYRVHKDSLRRLLSVNEDAQNYLLSSQVYDELLLVDSVLYGSLLFELDKVTFSENGILTTDRISINDGLSQAKINDLAFFNNKVYLAQSDGLYSFDHNATFSDTTSYHVLVDEVITKDSVYASHQTNSTINLPHDIGLIQIKSKALNYAASGKFEYSFRLSKDAPWTSSSSNVVSFSDLPPAFYSFEMRARVVNGEWMRPGKINFRIVPALWQTYWFRVAVIGFSFVFIAWVSVVVARNVEKRRELKRDKMISDLRALKAQINPHFLFNSLSSINSFILDNHAGLAESYLTKYSRLMRKILDHSDRLTVSFYEEKEAIELYVSLEQLRLPDTFSFSIDLDNEIDFEALKIPSMIIQPILENAIWHGIQPSNRKGEITLEIIKNKELVEVQVSDNGVGFQYSTESLTPHGLSLVQERIGILNRIHNVRTEFKIASNANGTTVMFSYPIALD